MALGNECFEADGATFVRNRDIPIIRNANHVTRVNVSTPTQINRLLERVEAEFAGFPHRRFDLDFSAPPSLEARLALDGYQRSGDLFMVLEGKLVGKAKAYDIKIVQGDTGWDDYLSLLYLDHQEDSQRTGASYDQEVVRGFLHSRRTKSPPVHCWLAYVNGRPRAYCSSWAGVDSMGFVEDLFTHPEYRHRGLATALVHHCVADCRSQDAGAVTLVADPLDTPKFMYAAMGFRPVAIESEYWKNV